MKFIIEVEAESFDEARELLLTSLTGEDPAPKKGKPKPKPEPDPEPDPEPEPEQRPASRRKPKPRPVEDDETPPDLDYDTDVKPVIVALARAHGREAILDALGDFETEDGDQVTKGQELQEKDWAAAVAACTKLNKKLSIQKKQAEDE